MIDDFLEKLSLTRQGKNPCPTWGRPMEMYGKPWCPVCEKPELNGRELNLIQALKHIEAVGHPGFYDRMWNQLVEDYGFRNDSGFLLCFPERGERGEYDPRHWEDLQLIRATWGLEDCVLMWVSW